MHKQNVFFVIFLHTYWFNQRMNSCLKDFEINKFEEATYTQYILINMIKHLLCLLQICEFIEVHYADQHCF